MSTGCKGFIYKGWQVRYMWDARRGCWCYEASNPDRPQGARVIFVHPREAMRFIDRQEVGNERQTGIR